MLTHSIQMCKISQNNDPTKAPPGPFGSALVTLRWPEHLLYPLQFKGLKQTKTNETCDDLLAAINAAKLSSSLGASHHCARIKRIINAHKRSAVAVKEWNCLIHGRFNIKGAIKCKLHIPALKLSSSPPTEPSTQQKFLLQFQKHTSSPTSYSKVCGKHEKRNVPLCKCVCV